MLNRARAQELVRPARSILVVGELILDEFIWGKVSRISPEAPVPVVEVHEETYNAGGAANVARNLAEFSSNIHLLGLTGEDAAGERLRSLLAECGVQMDAILRDPNYATIQKTRIIARTQQVVRVDRERRTAFTAAQRAHAVERFEALLPSLDAVILEDYAKGLLDQELADAFIERARTHGKIIAADPNPSNPIVWHRVTCVTPNRSEAFRAAGLPWSEPSDDPRQDQALLAVGSRLLDLWECEMLLITLSEAGMMLFRRGEPPYHIPTRAQKVFDVSGAGDTAIALFTLALANGAKPEEAAEISNHASGIVVAKLGTATVTREELLASFEE